MTHERKKHKNIANKISLRFVNNFLTVVIIGINFYIIALPLLPQLTLWWNKHGGSTPVAPYSGSLANETDDESSDLPRKAIPEEDRLVIPALAMNELVYEGTSTNTVNKGVWRRPQTSTPDKGGNTVLVGHRFTYKDPAVFYHLDKMKVGDHFAVYWQKKEYIYEVISTKVVPATAIEVEAQTNEAILTLYTCTPVWSAKDRLVVVSKLLTPLEKIGDSRL